MAKEIDLTTFQASIDSTSASPVYDALQGTVQGECIHTPTECNAQQQSASYSIEQIASICGVARRTAFKYAAEVIEVHHWLKEADFRINGAYNQFALDEIKSRKSYLKFEEYRQAVHDSNADKFQTTDTTQPASALAKPEILSQPSPVTALDRIRSDRYNVPEFGSNRLANAQQRANTQRFSLEDTRNRTLQAFMNLAIQTAEELTAEELERQARLEQVYQDSYTETLEELQIKNAAKQDAVTDYSILKQQVMGNAQGQA